MAKTSELIESIEQRGEFVRSHQWAIECNSQMEDVLATIGAALLEIAEILKRQNQE